MFYYTEQLGCVCVCVLNSTISCGCPQLCHFNCQLPKSILDSLEIYSCFSVSCFRTPEQCPSVVSLLSESYNPHVRCGAAMALGICCAGTGNKVSASPFIPYLLPGSLLQI